MTQRDVVVLGSTGSIGTQALDVCRANPDRFRVVALTAGGSNPDLFQQQVDEWSAASGASTGWARRPRPRPPRLECDVVLNGITGAVGLRPTLAALDAGNTLALANKESLIIGGPVVTEPREARPDRAGRLRALGPRAVPARRLRRGGTPPRADRERRPVPRAYGEPTWPASRSRRRWPTRPGPWGRSSPSTPRPWSTRAWRSSRRTCCSGSPSTASRSSCTRRASCTRWSSSSTARRWCRPARRPC